VFILCEFSFAASRAYARRDNRCLALITLITLNALNALTALTALTALHVLDVDGLEEGNICISADTHKTLDGSELKGILWETPYSTLKARVPGFYLAYHILF